MLVNPSINISIGAYGKDCNRSFHKHFSLREKSLENYASFYSLNSLRHSLEYYSISNKGFHDSFQIENEDSLESQIASEDGQYFFRSFINKIYNHQINLLSQLNTDVNYKIINVNLIFGSFEGDNAQLVKNLVQNIQEFCDEGMISNIVVKAFVILSKDGDLLKAEEEIAAYQNLEKLNSIQQEHNTIFSNIIFIDDKNTSAVYLDINTSSIGLVLNEFITYLMTNHYNMIGNLMNPNLLSLGIGMIYFDEIFFRIFFQKRIIEEKIIKEQLDHEEHKIITSHYKNIRDKYFYSIVNKDGSANYQPLIQELENLLSANKSCTMKSWKFLLSNLVGDFQAVILKEPLKHTEKISLHDVIYQLIINSSNLISGINIFTHKQKEDNLDELKLELANYSKQNEEGLFDEKIEELSEEIKKATIEIYEEKRFIEKTVSDFKSNGQPVIREEIQNANNKESLELEKEKKNLKSNFKQKPCWIRWFNLKDYREQQSVMNKKIDQNKSDFKTANNALTNLEAILYPLIEIEEKLQKDYSALKKSIQVLLDLDKLYRDAFSKSELPNYLFVDHIINKQLLEKYFRTHKDALIRNLSDHLMEVINNGLFSEFKYKRFIVKKIDISIASIIDFKMVNYLLNRYDDLELLRKADTVKDVTDLKTTSVPFFNADNLFPANDSHSLILHHKASEADTLKLKNQLKTIFPIVPQHIHTLNPNKFSLLKIDVISSLNYLVKYNMGKKRMKSAETNR